MEIGLAVGGAFISSALNVLFDRLAPHGDLLNMLQKHTDDVQLFEKLGDILLGLQIVLSDAENKQASNQFVSQWLNKLQTAVDGAENLIEQVNYEALRLKVEGQLQNLTETSNQQCSLSLTHCCCLLAAIVSFISINNYLDNFEDYEFPSNYVYYSTSSDTSELAESQGSIYPARDDSRSLAPHFVSMSTHQ